MLIMVIYSESVCVISLMNLILASYGGVKGTGRTCTHSAMFMGHIITLPLVLAYLDSSGMGCKTLVLIVTSVVFHSINSSERHLNFEVNSDNVLLHT